MVFLISVSSADWLDIPRGKGEQCIEPTEIMRKQHMQFLFHDRDLTMREGDRSIRHSLVDCVECHTQVNQQQKAIPINASGQFCAVCHEAVSVKIDCFSCHANIPDSSSGYSGFMNSGLPESARVLMKKWAFVP
ncbi:MAG: Hdr-like menaquinol oxidoreductase cytochrome c subunit [Gammaproteobacteria bacterium]|nr:Hdr-like menaquinol oxidoreductase cytochrome c subunit [Gammaproteobacteria bacterium]